MWDKTPVFLTDIGFPHYVLYPTGELINTLDGIVRYPQKGNEYVLWSKDRLIRERINSKHLLSFEFDSPRRRYDDLSWSNLGYLGYSKYEVTCWGEVYSLKTFKYLVGNLSFDGYYRVLMKRDDGVFRTECISRLVAKTFIPNPENKPEVDHINGDKSNNSIYNLRWVYGWENVHFAMQNFQRVSKLTDQQIYEICERLERGERVIDIMHAMNLPKHLILGIKSGCHARISNQFNIPKNKHF